MSKLEVNTIDTQCGSTLTLGSSGKTITIPAGATISNAGTSSGFGGSGAVSWETTPKTSTFTGATGVGYFVNTSGGAVTLNLPTGSAGNIIAVADYTRSFATHNLTIDPAGSDKIGGIAQNLALDIDGQSVTLLFVDSTEGWINIQYADDTKTGTPPFIGATGGTITTSGNDRIHTFTSPGTFAVSSLASTPANNAVAYTVIAGGAGGGYNSGPTNHSGAGGGAGGYREFVTQPITPYTASPIASTTGITVSIQSYPITVGAGGAGSGGDPQSGTSGSSTSGLGYTSAGGGGAGANANPGNSGGSGGGGSSNGVRSGGAGNTPPTSPPQGNPGGSGTDGPGPQVSAGGGGGATSVGTNASGGQGGNGGGGATTSISGSPVARAGGGGGGSGTTNGTASAGGGVFPQKNGTGNTGGGGGGSSYSPSSNTGTGGTGGSGVVIIRYKIQ